MDYLICSGTVEKEGGEIRGLKLLGMPHRGDLICREGSGGELEHYEIIGVEHCSGDSAPFPCVHLLLRQQASGLA
jgi:hypothetical protein